ncbi:MAG TPA: glycosyltransferase [Cyanobacteria bacterium UBA11149]|nr:glycosyltransferase [Cyanobacteria bacterium UBA11166]HBR74036.1 glycosyltransferase [Cyanobacteria bacterium UBA11159]HBS67860.1 glycosyltransferase [Cyanobacteria bacterium UBA11153]HBW90652.1 glycosyltransferase [Cyanobacteria bacterium UBA11149]HCA93711.1 glycosyltransferase [Cyanobacteria bacterium UBA9226]
MGRKIVGMISSYKNLNQTDWLWQQTPHPFGVWGNIQMMANAIHPDILLLYNFDRFPEPTPKQSDFPNLFQLFKKHSNKSQPNRENIWRGVPKERIVSLVREPPFAKLHHKRIAEYQSAQIYCGYVSGPDDFAPIPDYMPAIWYHANSFRELNEMPPPEKMKNCSWITSGIDRTPEHQRRLAFLKSLGESGLEFDLYGRGLPDWTSGKGTLKNKWYGMASYYYNLAIENYAENDWYVSEKLWDSLLAWCLPIYYGGSAADKLLPPGSFLRLPSLDEKGIAYLKEVTATPDAWHEAKAAIAEARQVILHKLNLLNFLSNLVEKLG